MATSKKTTVSLGSIQRQAGSSNTYFVRWSFKNDSKTDHYRVVWGYYTGNHSGSGKKAKYTWFSESENSENNCISTYSPPENAVKIRVHVCPVSKKHKVKNKEETYFTGKFCGYKDLVLEDQYIIAVPPTPSVSVTNKTLTASIDYRNPVGTDDGLKVKKIEFQLVSVNGTNAAAEENHTVDLNTKMDSAITTFSIRIGKTYKVRARAIRVTKVKNTQLAGYSLASSKTDKNDTSDWSDFSSTVGTIPGQVTGLSVSAKTELQFLLTWTPPVNAKSYEIQFTKNKQYFETYSSQDVKTETFEAADGVKSRYITVDESGTTWYFRMRATNDSGTGAWSSIVDKKIGSKPDAPTTWSYSTVGKIGTPVVLNWTHNSTDSSTQQAAQIEIKVGTTGTARTIQINNDTSTYSLATGSYSDKSVIYWRVRTKGIHASYSEWSTQRQITLYTPPSLSLGIYDAGRWIWDTFNFETDNIYTAWSDGGELINTITKFPLLIIANASPSTQKAISFTITITANESYEALDETGVLRTITEGEEIYSNYLEATTGNTLNLRLTPSDIDLETDVTYTLTAQVAMDSGLTASFSYDFDVDWQDTIYNPDAEITVDMSRLVAYITPYCEDDYGERIDNVMLSVYRREYDGTFTEIMSDIDGSLGTTITDPHPSLDYARYRIVATSRDTGGIGYYDLPGVVMDESSIIIQWDEAWVSYNAKINADEEPADSMWSGSMLRLPYNIDISAENKGDVSLIEYIGRKNPVSYYGTQRGEEGRWSFEIRKDDVDTLYALRRLSVYRGDVYIREPSGIGYWANVQVSYTETHNKSVIPVSMTVKRVEGGM